MSNLRFAVLGWIVPLVMLALLGLLALLDRTVPYPEPEGEPPPCYVDEHDEMICPEQPMPPQSTLRRVVSAISVEWITSLFALAGLVTGLGFSTTAVIRARKKPEERTAFRLGLAALVLLIGVPGCLGLVALLIIASFPIRG